MLAILVTTLLAGMPVELPAKVFASTRVAEFTLTYDGKKTTTAGRLLLPSEGPVPELTFSFTARSGCPKKAKKLKRPIKVLAFFDATGKQLVGFEQDLGHATDFDPAYPALVEAVLEAKGWTDERMRAVGAEQLWQRPKKALASSNPFLPQLAAHFLAAHDVAEAVDAGTSSGAPSHVDLCQ